MTSTDIRHADLPELLRVLQSQSIRRVDTVASARNLFMSDSNSVWLFSHQAAQITDDGVIPESSGQHEYAIGEVAAEHMAEKLKIPAPYWKRCSTEAPGLLATNANHWLSVTDDSFYVRAYAPDQEGGVGFMRAMLSSRYRTIDSIDVLTAAVNGIHNAGLSASELSITGDLSERRMYVRIDAPQVQIEALDLVQRYTDPATGRTGRDYPVLGAGVIIRNSDVGHGAFDISPYLKVLVCKNGMTRRQDSIRKVHVGAKQSDGIIDWSEETLRRELALIESQTTDAVRTFLTTEYLQRVVDEIRAVNGRRIAEPLDKLKDVTMTLHYSNAERDMILNAFMHGGDMTPFGVAQAITYVAQSPELDADRAAKFEDDAWRAMELAAR